MTPQTHLQTTSSSSGQARGLIKLVRNRSFTLTTGAGKQSSLRRLKNGVPQESVLAPPLFNIFAYDLPVIIGRKFAYADDLTILLCQRVGDIRDLQPYPPTFTIETQYDKDYIDRAWSGERTLLDSIHL